MDSEINEIVKICKDKSDRQKWDKIILQPFEYIEQSPGKTSELQFPVVFNQWLNISMDKLDLIRDIFQMQYSSSLLIDDIEDNSILRKGKPVAHSIYGLASTLNAANYISMAVLEKIHLLNHPDATKVYTEQLLEMHRGQGIEIYWRDSFICPTEREYKLMAVRKTGALLMLPMRLVQLFSENKKDFSKFMTILGLYYQIWDDYCNLRTEFADDKGFFEDLTEGKFSFPIVHAVQSGKGNEVLNILRQRTNDVKVKKYCVGLLEELGSLKYTTDTLASLDKQLRIVAAKLGPNPLMDGLLDKLLSWKTDKH